MLENATDRVHRALMHAQNTAARSSQPEVGAEHLLFGILETDGSLACNALHAFEIDFDLLRESLTGSSGPGLAEASGAPSLSREAREVLEQASREAQNLGHDFVGAEHLLLSLLEQQESPVSRALADFGMTARDARSYMESFFGRLSEDSGQSADKVDHLGACESCGSSPPCFAILDRVKGDPGKSKEWILCGDCLARNALNESTSVVAVVGKDAGHMSSRETTEGVKLCLSTAVLTARELKSQCVEPDHLLAGLLAAETGVACSALKGIGINTREVEARLRKRCSPSPIAQAGYTHFATSVADILADACHEAELMGHGFIGTEHLLLSILRFFEKRGTGRIHPLFQYGLVKKKVEGILGLQEQRGRPGGLPPSSESEGNQALQKVSGRSREETETAQGGADEVTGVQVKSSYSMEATHLLSELHDLQEQKRQAIEQERFEEAGTLRDRIIQVSQEVEEEIEGSHRVTFTYDEETLRKVLSLMDRYWQMKTEQVCRADLVEWLKKRFFRLPGFAVAQRKGNEEPEKPTEDKEQKKE